MRVSIAVAGLLGLLAVAALNLTSARAEQLKGNMFINAMQGNTLSGKTSNGVPFNAYFLSGGIVNYEEAGGAKDAGEWHMDSDGDVCVTFQKINDGKEDCFVVTLDGKKLSWKGKTGSGSGMLRGSIVEGFIEE